MKLNRKYIAITGFAAAVGICVAATPPAPVKYINLKVLPKNVSTRELQSLMVDDFQDGLGVTCNFCHANASDGHGLDFASDAKPEKEIARKMMRMTLGLNKKYFQVKHPKLGSDALVVNCNTCHKGQPFPDGAEQK